MIYFIIILYKIIKFQIHWITITLLSLIKHLIQAIKKTNNWIYLGKFIKANYLFINNFESILLKTINIQYTRFWQYYTILVIIDRVFQMSTQLCKNCIVGYVIYFYCLAFVDLLTKISLISTTVYPRLKKRFISEISRIYCVSNFNNVRENLPIGCARL